MTEEQRAYIKSLEFALDAAADMLDSVAELNGFPEGDNCLGLDGNLCGNALCAEGGCLQIKRRWSRLALAGAL